MKLQCRLHFFSAMNACAVHAQFHSLAGLVLQQTNFINHANVYKKVKTFRRFFRIQQEVVFIIPF